MRRTWNVLTTVVLVLAAAGVVSAATTEELEAAMDRLEKRIAAQDKEISQLKSQLTGEGLNVAVNRQIEKLLKQREPVVAAPELPGWLDNFKLYGDLRLLLDEYRLYLFYKFLSHLIKQCIFLLYLL